MSAGVAAISADDKLLTAVGRRDPACGPLPNHDPLAWVLLALRCDIDAEPVPPLVDTDASLRIVAAERDHRDGDSVLVGLLWALVLSVPLWTLLLWAVLWVGAR